VSIQVKKQVVLLLHDNGNMHARLVHKLAGAVLPVSTIRSQNLALCRIVIAGKLARRWNRSRWHESAHGFAEMVVPGATMSGLMRPSSVGPMLVK